MNAVDDRGQVWRGGIFLALSTAGMLAMPFLAELAPDWVGKDLSDKQHLIMGLSGIALMLGIWQLQEGLGWPRRTWRGRALALVVLPCFILPAWLGLHLYARPFDPDVELRPRQLPGFRVSLPDWNVKSQSTADFWDGNLTLSHRGDMVVVRWNPGDPSKMWEFLDSFLPSLADEKIASESATVESRPAHTVYVKQHGDVVAYTVFSCGDGRLLVVASGAENERDSRRFHDRLLLSVSCVAGAAVPAIVYAKVSLPGFRSLKSDPSERLFQRGTEELMVSTEHREMAMFDRLRSVEGREEFLKALFQGLGAHAVGEPQLTERDAPPGEGDGKRQLWSYRLSDSSTVTWTAWRCTDARWFFAMSTAAPTVAVDLLLGATCP
jgi:hypothetical protein